MESIAQLIDQWNSSRLELFKISKPDSSHKFYGVMRFFYECNDKYHSKCIRVFSDMNVKHLVPLLWNKFSVLTRGVRVRDVRLYERCGNNDKLLTAEERPLLIQLYWCKGDKEGAFVLKSIAKECCSDKDTVCVNSCMDANGNPCLSKYCDDDQHTSQKLTNSYLSRTISNPESLMKLRRKATLEMKLQQIFRSGNINGGGTLKIYGESINPLIPYKSLLLSIDDTAAFVVREILNKYGLEDEDSNDYCLVKVTIRSLEGTGHSRGNELEEVLHKSDSPLKALLGAVQDPCFIKFKVIKCPPHLRKRKKSLRSPEKTQPRLSRTRSSTDPHSGTDHHGLRPKYDHRTVDVCRPNFHVDSGIESQQSCSHSITYPSNEQLPIYDPVNNNIYSTPPLPQSYTPVKRSDSEYRPLPSYEESIQRSRFMRNIPVAHERLLSPFRGSMDSFSFSSDCMEDISYNVDSAGESINNISEIKRPVVQEIGLSLVSDLDAQLSRHLPVQITYFKSKEDLLLDSLILDLKTFQAKFKLSLAYVLHLMVVDIIRLTCINKTSKTDQELIIGNFIEKVTAKIRQSIMQNRSKISMQTFWLANCTEFLYLLKNNPLLSQLNKDNFQRFYELFADNTQCCFQYISYCFKDDVMNTLPVLLGEHADDDEDRDNLPLSKKAHNPSVMSDIVRTLSSCMSVLQQCLVNPALIIQVMSRIFHLINAWIFNKFIDNPSLISKHWAVIITSRIDRIRRWSVSHELLLAADCYLQRCIQMCQLVVIEKTDVEILYNESVDLVQINSVQLRYFLENYTYGPNEPRVPQIWIDFVTSGVTQVADKIFEEDNIDITLKEEEDLNLPLLLPDDGYHVDVLFGGIPDGFIEYLDELHREWCFYKISHQNIHFDWLCQKVAKKEIYNDTPALQERYDPTTRGYEVSEKPLIHSHNRHQLKLSDFKGNINTLGSGVDPGRMQKFFQGDQCTQEVITTQTGMVQLKNDQENVVERCSTYASSFSTEVFDVEDGSSGHLENLQAIRQVRSVVEKIIDEDVITQEQLQSVVGDMNNSYDKKLRDMMIQFEKERSDDLFLINYRQLRLSERREEAFQKYRKSKDTESNKVRIIQDMDSQAKSFFPLSNTFPGYGSNPPQSFVSTSLALGSTLYYPPKIKPKPRSNNVTWRSRSQSVLNICQEDMGLSGLGDMRPRSKSTDKYYSRTLDGMENLTFQEKLDMFEYGIFSTSH